MADRYFVEQPIDGPRAQLTSSEAHHLAHVMRARAGDEIVLFDGSGAEFAARVEVVGRSEIELSILARTVVDRELPIEITLGVTMPKGDRQRWLVEKAVELGVARVVPLVSERSEHRESPQAIKRLARAVVEASKQCGRNRLMTIEPAARVDAYLSALPGNAMGLIAHVGGPPLATPLEKLPALPDQIHLAVGPEGGFTDAEIERATSAAWQVVGLGPRILRVETAAAAMVAALAVWAAEV